MYVDTNTMPSLWAMPKSDSRGLSTRKGHRETIFMRVSAIFNTICEGQMLFETIEVYVKNYHVSSESESQSCYVTLDSNCDGSSLCNHDQRSNHSRRQSTGESLFETSTWWKCSRTSRCTHPHLLTGCVKYVNEK